MCQGLRTPQLEDLKGHPEGWHCRCHTGDGQAGGMGPVSSFIQKCVLKGLG